MTSHDAGRITKKPKKQSATLSEAAADIDHIFSTSNNIQKQNTKAASIALTQNDAACPKTKTITDSASSKSLAKNKKTENTKTSNNITATPVTAASDALFTDTRGLTTGKRRTTEEGYPIFTPDELNIGNGGDTPDCPFDCECCF